MSVSIRQVRLLVIGVGNVGRRVLELVAVKEDALRDRLGLRLVLVGAADSSGAAVCPSGLDPLRLSAIKAAGTGMAVVPDWGRPGMSALDMVRTVQADLLLEASPGNLRDGQPGLGCIEAALDRGMHVVTANKAPLVLAFPRLRALADERGVCLRYDATVAGGLPVTNLGERDLALADIMRFEGVVNLTANYVLARMGGGASYDEALAEAQAAGHAEADPSYDVEGWDSAAKLIILAQCVLRYPATLSDVAVTGIGGITAELLRQAAAAGRTIKLVAVAEREGGRYRLTVQPTWLEADHPLATLGAEQMGVIFHTDVFGVLSAAIVEPTPLPTAAAMLRDLAEITRIR